VNNKRSNIAASDGRPIKSDLKLESAVEEEVYAPEEDGDAEVGIDEPQVNVWLVGQQASPSQRRHRYVPESFAHPAKMLPELARKVIQTYSKDGDLVVDPMSGIGTTGVEAVWLGRRYVGIEVEVGFAQLQERNLELAVAQGASAGRSRVIRGDARLDHDVRGVDLVAFSPPYQDAIHSQGNELGRIERKIKSGTASPELIRRFGNWQEGNEKAQAGMRPAGYSVDARNLGHFKGDRYRESMRMVYSRAYESLRPGGYLAVVTKDQRDRKTGELTNVYVDTVSLCRSLGFLLHQHVVAILCRIDQDTRSITPRTSHWQRIAVQKSSEKGKVILLDQFEDVAVFRKPVEA